MPSTPRHTSQSTSPVKVDKYHIENRAQETECDHCAQPLYIGDAAYEAATGNTRGIIYCSRSCAEKDEA